MRKLLLATTALAAAGAFATVPVLAADKLSVGLGGYMQQWIGMSSLDGAAGDGGVSQYSDSEFYVTGKLEADNGLAFSVKVEVEGNTSGDQIDESQATVSGSFGQIVLGSEDHPASLMHYGNKDVGVGLNCGDASFIAGITSCAREGGKGLGTAGWLIGGDDHKVAYYTPRMGGVQFGAAYIPNTTNEDKGGAPVNNDTDAVSVGLNYMGDLGGSSVALSVGHYQASQTGTAMDIFNGTVRQKNADGEVDVLTSTYTKAMYEADVKARAAYDKALADGTMPDYAAAEMAKTQMMAHQVSAMAAADDRTFTNFGLRVGFGAFAFDVAYAAHDGGAYKFERMDKPAGDETSADDDIVMHRLVKDTSQDYEVTSAGVNYSEGPMAVSLSHMMAEADDGSDANATMLSFSYDLAPGIASRSSLIAGEQDAVQGTAFVTGITLGF